MRKIWLNRDDFEMFHQDISPLDYEFFRTHVETFKRMWLEQTKRFWTLFLNTFEHFIWKHGCVKDFPMKSREMTRYIDEILEYIKEQFVNGKVSTAKKLVYDCVIVTQNRHCITILDKAAYAQNPFYMKETREVFRQLFGAPNDKKTYMKVLCGLPMYVKFAGSAVVALRRWMEAPEIDPENETAKRNYFENIFVPLGGRSDALLRERLGDRLLGMSTKQIAALAYEVLKEPVDTELEAQKKKKKRKKKSKSVNENEDPEKAVVSAHSEKTKASVSTEQETKPLLVNASGSKSGEPLKNEKTEKIDSLKTQLDDSLPKKVKNDDSVKTDSLASPDDSADTAKKVSMKGGAVGGKSGVVMETADVSKKSSTDALKVKKEKYRDWGEKKLLLLNEPEVKVQNRRKEPTADSAAALNGSDGSSVSDSASQDSPKATKKGGGGGEESVDESCDSSTRKKLHICGLCGREELTAKTFKRCQKCRGKTNPKYYCSRECQVRDWKTHKLDHRDDP